MAAIIGRTGQKATEDEDNDVYTALLVIATGFVLVAVICVAYQFGSYYGFEYLFRSAPDLSGG